jgi:hypothetical protein
VRHVRDREASKRVGSTDFFGGILL